MKKKLTTGLLLLGAVFILSACSNKPTAEEASKILMETELYGEESEKFEKYFNVEVDQATSDLNKAFQESYASTAGDVEVSDEEVAKMGAKILKALQEKVTYQVQILEEDAEKATVEYRIKGLDMAKFLENLTEKSNDFLVKKVQEAGIKNIETVADLQELSSQADLETVNQIIADFQKDGDSQMALFAEGIDELETVAEETKLTLNLRTNEEDRNAWEIENETEFRNALMAAVLQL